MIDDLNWKENYIKRLLKVCLAHSGKNQYHGRCVTLQEVYDKLDKSKKLNNLFYSGKAS